MTINGVECRVPSELLGRRNMEQAYRDGWRHGITADAGGTPLNRYRRDGERNAYDLGFVQGQAAKGSMQ